jgi:hypothetical protein
MKSLCTSILILFISVWTASAQSPQLAWAKQFGTAGVSDASVLAIDSLGNSYMAGVYPASGISFGNITLSGAGSQENCFIAKFDAEGNAVWAKRIKRIGGFQDGTNPDRIVIDASANVYFCGYYLDGATIDNTLIPGDYGYFIAKLNESGSLQWIRVTVSPDNIGPHNSLFINEQDEICMTGLFNSTMTFDDNYTLTNTTNQAGVDGFMVKYNTEGEVINAVQLGVVNPEYNTNTTYPSEYFRFDNEENIYRMVKSTNTILKYNPLGELVLTIQLNTTSALSVFDFAIDPNQNIVLAGVYDGTLLFDGVSIPNLSTQYAQFDAILIKLSPEGDLIWNYPIQTQDNDVLTKVRIDAVGNIYSLGYIAAAPLGTLVRMMVTKLSSNAEFIWEENVLSTAMIIPRNMVQAYNGGNVQIMGTFKNHILFNDTTEFTTTGNVWRIFLAQYGLCAASSPTISSEQTSYCAGSGVLITPSDEAGYLWSNGATTSTLFADEAGEYYVFSLDTLGCYAQSNIIYIEELPLPNDSISIDQFTLTAFENNAVYSWIDCDSNEPIAGATSQSFTAEASGLYAVEITNSDNCTVTSECISLTLVSLNESAPQAVVSLYPNPVIDELYVRSEGRIHSLSVYNLLGEKLIDQKEEIPKIKISHLSPGVYVLLVDANEKSYVLKFVKQ